MIPYEGDAEDTVVPPESRSARVLNLKVTCMCT